MTGIEDYSFPLSTGGQMSIRGSGKSSLCGNWLKLPIHRGRRGQTPMRPSPQFGNDENPAGTESTSNKMSDENLAAYIGAKFN